MTDDPFSYVNETLEEDRKLTALETRGQHDQGTERTRRGKKRIAALQDLRKAEVVSFVAAEKAPRD